MMSMLFETPINISQISQIWTQQSKTFRQNNTVVVVQTLHALTCGNLAVTNIYVLYSFIL